MIKKTTWRGLVIPVLIFIFWCILARANLLNLQLIPSLGQVYQAFLSLIENKTLFVHLSVSLKRVMIGFTTAGFVAVPLGIVLGWIPSLHPWLNPSLHFLRQIPPVAWIPLFIMWFGIGEMSKNALIFYAAFFPILLNTQLGFSQISEEFWEVAKLYQFPWHKSLTKLVLPGSAAAVITGLRLGMGMSWRALVAAEMLAASSGLGYLITNARSLVRLDEMLAGIMIIGVIGLIIDATFIWLESRLPWTRSEPKGDVQANGYFSN